MRQELNTAASVTAHPLAVLGLVSCLVCYYYYISDVITLCEHSSNIYLCIYALGKEGDKGGTYL